MEQNNKEHLLLLYNNLELLNKSIKSQIEQSSWDDINFSIQKKEALINQIVAFERPYIDEIKNDKELSAKRKYLAFIEQENIELIKKQKNETLKELGIVKAKKRLINTYEPTTKEPTTTIELKDCD